MLEFYKNKKVLITGHTGFKGSWLSIWLNMLGAEVIGVALDPINKKDNYVLSGISSSIKDYREDIRKPDSVKEIVFKEKPEILFHLAAQPIVLDSYKKPVYTYETNVMGTVNMLETFRLSDSLKIGVFITTDKCYENIEKNYSYKETDPMGGYDPYSSSKGAAELAISSYRNSYFTEGDKKIASARAGNVIGGGDWSPYRLIVDIISALESNTKIKIRNPQAVRPWQHVLEPLGGYLILAAKMHMEQQYDEAWNFGPETENIVTVKQLLEEVIKYYGKGTWIDVSEKEKLHEATLLSLDITKAKNKLNWQPKLSFRETVQYTVDWYKKYKTENVMDLCTNQIKQYMKNMEHR
ncbi:CDP-glucose 4,6-dehydratase [Salinivirga cyanobacteriivorans]|uniref:CDP-glucose 4,6-dehydratase n=1 Tax=Salinivirga cyanobacteriivorans TaxID=1307839 RepID=A0A0S2I0J3_9BACT|nr:CDP-glucose 4,6-dehydratase [Salinivirga cyanobacteriivorans]ALO15755.1 CDP-glucose 4,6-dehydratase [Salinivirga cyanobacteriivorans]